MMNLISSIVVVVTLVDMRGLCVPRCYLSEDAMICYGDGSRNLVGGPYPGVARVKGSGWQKPFNVSGSAFPDLTFVLLTESGVRCSEIKRPSRVRVDLNGLICSSTSTTMTTMPREPTTTTTTTHRQITSGVDNVSDSRQEEKTETQGFNERFAAFIEQVRFLEARIKHFFDMLASMANTTTSNI